MPTNRELAAAIGVLTVAFVLLAYTAGLDVGLPVSTRWIALIANLLVLIFTPVVMSKARWTALGAVVAGVIAIIAAILGLATIPPSLVVGPGVGLVLALLFTYFSFRAYQQK